MFKLDKLASRKILTSELGFSFQEADLYLENYPLLHDLLMDSVKTWLKDRSISDKVFEGISIIEVMNAHNCHFLSAIKKINNLLTRSLSDKQKKALISSLKTAPIRA